MKVMSVAVGLSSFVDNNATGCSATLPRIAGPSDQIRTVQVELTRVGSRKITLPKKIDANTSPEIR